MSVLIAFLAGIAAGAIGMIVVAICMGKQEEED